MSFTVLRLVPDDSAIGEVFVDRSDDGYIILKQYGPVRCSEHETRSGPGDWVVLTPAMLSELSRYVVKEGIGS